MWEAAVAERWDHTAHVIACLVNCNRGKHSRKVKADEFHPFKKHRRGTPLQKGNIHILKAFVPPGNARHYSYDPQTKTYTLIAQGAAVG